MSEIKAGDWVRCIDTHGAVSLTYGKHYRVAEIDGGWIVVTNDADFTQGFAPSLFQKVEHPAATQEVYKTPAGTKAREYKLRKMQPVTTGLLRYFPDACLDVARLSYLGNEKHNPGEPLHWARGKSMDQEDTCVRHMITAEEMDTDYGPGNEILHATASAWRALANLQLIIEKKRAAGEVYPPLPLL